MTLFFAWISVAVLAVLLGLGTLITTYRVGMVDPIWPTEPWFLISNWREPSAGYLIEHTHHEFTSMCPITGHPDFAAITVRYVPDKTCVELKSLKLYFHAFRNEGIFFEAATNQICDDLGRVLAPRSLTIVADWKARGGFTSRITAEYRPGPKPRR